MKNRTRLLIVTIAVMVVAILAVLLPATVLAAPPTVLGVYSFPVGETTFPNGVVIPPGYNWTVPSGHLLTMTVNGVEKGQVLETTKGTNTVFVPGTYLCKVVFTAAEDGVLSFAPPGPPGTPSVDYDTRQALYVDAAGPVAAKSVPAAITQGGRALNSTDPGDRANLAPRAPR